MSNESFRLINNSLIRDESRKFGRNGYPPTAEDLKNAKYVRRGFPYNTVILHGTTDDEPYNKWRIQTLIKIMLITVYLFLQLLCVMTIVRLTSISKEA